MLCCSHMSVNWDNLEQEHPLLYERLKWEAANPRPEPLCRAEQIIVRALRDGGFGSQSQVTFEDRFEIATDDLIVSVRLNV
jgi:hypothetical protein